MWDTGVGAAGDTSPAGDTAQAGQERWQPPGAVENALYQARMRGDWPAYFDALAGTSLYLTVPRARADDGSGEIYFSTYPDPYTGIRCLAVSTEGMLPAPAEDPVFYGFTLGWYARGWTDSDPQLLVVNPGSPCEARLPTSPEHRAVWLQHAEAAPRAACGCRHPHSSLRALSVGGPLHGPVAHGLACGALLSVHNSELWNAMAYHGGGYRDTKNRLEEGWGITDRAGWHSAQERLLRADMVSPVWEFALDVRRALALDFAGPVETEHWKQAAERALWRHAARAREPRLTPGGVTAPQGPAPAETEAQIAGVRRLIGRITRYEARYRADGLLPEEGTSGRPRRGITGGLRRWPAGGWDPATEPCPKRRTPSCVSGHDQLPIGGHLPPH